MQGNRYGNNSHFFTVLTVKLDQLYGFFFILFTRSVAEPEPVGAGVKVRLHLG